jgi:sugar lactone lactonase YvrE
VFRRLARLTIVAALAATTLVALGGDVASPQTGPIGYSVGGQFDGIDDCEFWSIDMGSGELTQISDPSTEVNCADGLTFAPDGTLYAYTNNQVAGAFVNAMLVTIDLGTGEQTEIGPLPNVFTGQGGMTFDAAGNLWLYSRGFDTPASCVDNQSSAVCLYEVDPATAAATFVGTVSETNVLGLTANCTPEVLAITTPPFNGTSSGTQIQRVDTATAALDPVVELPETFSPQGLDYDSAGELWVLAGRPRIGIGPMEVEQVDLATGTTTHTPLTVGGEPFAGFLAGLAISPISCPVPPPEPAPEIVLAPTFTG